MAFILARSALPQIARRSYAAAAAVSHGHGHGDKSLQHPLFGDHPVAPVCTYDDYPIPFVPFTEGYQKVQQTFNMFLAASVAVFLGISAYVWKTDAIGLKKGAPPKWYTQRKIGKGLGDI